METRQEVVLGRKQTSDHEDWLEVFAAISASPDHDRARTLVSETAAEVRSTITGMDRVAYGWSGGKDSQALQVVMEAAGVTDCVLVISALEYPAFLAWVTDHMPWGLHVRMHEHLNLEWLAANPHMLFPQDSATATRWFALMQRGGIKSHAVAHRLDAVCLGRRKADGNNVRNVNRLGEHGDAYLYRDTLLYSPLAYWSHEDVLNVIAAYRKPLPPYYGWPRGFRVGTGPWPQRQWTGSIPNGWAEVRTIDPGVVETAARFGIPGAREALCAA